MRPVLGVLGMPGSGKSQIADFLRTCGLPVVRLGGFVEEEIERRGLPPTSASETIVRNSLREEFGKDVLAKRVLEMIANDDSTTPFVLDGVASPEEDLAIRSSLGKDYFTIAVLVDRLLRYTRLETRGGRHLTNEQAEERDLQEIHSLRKAECIVLADYFVLNNRDLKTLLNSTLAKVVEKLLLTVGGLDHLWIQLDSEKLITKIEQAGTLTNNDIWLILAKAQLLDSPILNWHACKIIGDHRYIGGEEFLMRIGARQDIEFDQSSLHRIAAYALSRIRIRTEKILPLLRSNSSQTRKFAVDVLGELGDEEAFDAIEHLLVAETDEEVILWAGLALAKIAKKSLLPELEERLSALVEQLNNFKRYIAFDALQRVNHGRAELLVVKMHATGEISDAEDEHLRSRLRA